jgi:two-component system sensor histidine kinase KdpD
VGLVGLLLWPFHPDTRPLTAAACLSISLMGIAINWGTGPALLGSVLSALYINFYYVPPIDRFSFRLAQNDDLVALIAFLVMSIVVGQLSARAHRRADENLQLYERLRVAFEQASQLEALKRSERFKSVLLDTVTHDLRTPLTSIKAAATSLVDFRRIAATEDSRSLPDEKLLSIIVQQADRLNRFIDEMIEFAKLESGTKQPLGELQPVEEIIGNSLARAEGILANRTVTVECDENTGALLLPKPTAQVLFLLLENAARHSPAGTPICVTAIEEQDHILIAVDDQGPGVPPAIREKIFDKFFQHDSGLHKDGATAGLGLGLGLAIARGIIETQSGRIWVEDNRNGATGSKFVFSVPEGSKTQVMATERVLMQ